MLPACPAAALDERARDERTSIAGALFDPERGVYRGTGVLVSGCHVLTNHHVAFAGAPAPGQRMVFHTAPDARGRLREAAAGRVVAWNPGYWPARRFHQDWALIALDRPVASDAHAELPEEEVSSRSIRHLLDENGVISLGYVFPSLAVDGPAPQLRRQVCSLRVHGPERYTNCTVVPGNSGGPLVREVAGRQIVVGLNASWRIESGGVVATGEADLGRWNAVVPLDPLSGNVASVRRAMAQHACPRMPATARSGASAGA